MAYYIQEGDIVCVEFCSIQSTLSLSAEVIHKPDQYVSSWIFRDQMNGNIYYVSEGCTITKRISTPPKPRQEMNG